MLSKSTRQNIRTAQNRIFTDGKTSEITIYNDLSIPEDVIFKFIDLYEKRRLEKSIKSDQMTWKFRILEYFRKINKSRFNLMVAAMRSIENKYSAQIIIDGEIAGYFFGLKDHTGRVCVMQVVVSKNYSRYSPGMILLSKVLEKLHISGEIICFDLTNGEEPYKLSLGATLHSTEYFIYRRSVNAG
jgi:hypothetical protein